MSFSKAIIAFAAAAILSALSAFAVEPVAVQRWSYKTPGADAAGWTSGHGIPSLDGKSAITFEGKGPVFRLYGKRNYCAVSNISAGDAFRFTIRVDKLPKGTPVDFGLQIGAEKGGPAEWVCEYLCGKKWIKVGSFTVKRDSIVDDTEWFTDFVLAKAVKGELCVRVRAASDPTRARAGVYLLPSPNCTAYLAAWPVGEYDRKKVLCIGNSFTYFGGSFFAMSEIARSQGHSLQLVINTKGGQNFGQHLGLERSCRAMEEGGYDAALMQNQSMAAAYYASDSVQYANLKADAIAIAAKVREGSPKVRVILERTWAYPTRDGDWKGYGSGEAFDADLQKGSVLLASAMDAELSPIGNSFIKGRELGLPLYWTDSFHQGWLGAYLKACVNYLVIFGEPFSGYVSNCSQNPAQAALCREIASEVVLH